MQRKIQLERIISIEFVSSTSELEFLYRSITSEGFSISRLIKWKTLEIDGYRWFEDALADLNSHRLYIDAKFLPSYSD